MVLFRVVSSFSLTLWPCAQDLAHGSGEKDYLLPSTLDDHHVGFLVASGGFIFAIEGKGRLQLYSSISVRAHVIGARRSLEAKITYSYSFMY